MSLSDAENSCLSALLDEVIPPSPDGVMPGAGEIGLADRLADELGSKPDALAALRDGLGALDVAARDECGTVFAALGRDDRKRILARVGEAQPGLVPGLLFPTFVGYYEHPRVLVGLGLEPRPPHPGGYELEPFDESLLEGVRKGARLYRDC